LDPYATADEHYGLLREWLDAGTEPDRGAAMIERLDSSGLRGMGGAGFPTGRKWKLVRAEPVTPRTVICNADESEPGTFKDRDLLARAPHLVLEGMVLAGLAVGSHDGWVYIRHEYGPERERLQAAIDRARELGVLGDRVLGSDFGFDIQIFVSPGGYVLGEETALLEAMEGRRGEPRNKPPYPGVRGLHGRPTLINNVETFAQVPRALQSGTIGTKLFAVSGDVERPQVVEAPLGTPVSQLIEQCGGMLGGRRLQAFLPGGASTGFLSRDHEHLPLDWEPLREAGSALGSAAVLVVAEGADLLALAGNLTAFFRNESCGKCVPCRIGTEKALQLIEAREPAGLEKLRGLHEAMAATSICGLGQAALIPVLSILDRPDEKDGKGDRR
jgi:NADH:ubiquinone oxidoreductase subunit F (NADH-binding)